MKPKSPFAPFVLATLGLVLAVGEGHARGGLSAVPAGIAAGLIAGLDYGEAKIALDSGDPNDPAIIEERARLAVYEERCDLAVETLQKLPKSEETALLSDVARGCARVTASTVVVEDKVRNIAIRFQDEHDQAMAPMLFDTIDAARKSIGEALDVDWPKPTRVTVVRDHLSLAAMTGLPYEAARTTGTVAVAKWGRVTMLSPRAPSHGYGYRDTLAHELTHLALTRKTRDNAPLWLQEGMAKRQEIRWRDKGPFDDRPSPDAVAWNGIQHGKGYALDKLGPSIAMLPSADLAAIAYAEVSSFVRFLWDTLPPDRKGAFLDAMRGGADASTALARTTGMNLSAWDTRWRTQLASAGTAAPATPPKRGRELRERARLAELLLGRGHVAAADLELQPLGLSGAEEPQIAVLRASLSWAQHDLPKAEAILSKPEKIRFAYAPHWALLGLAPSVLGKPEADQRMLEALGIDPFDPVAACRDVYAGSVLLPAGDAQPHAAPAGSQSALCMAALAHAPAALGSE